VPAKRSGNGALDFDDSESRFDTQSGAAWRWTPHSKFVDSCPELS
jgi:hypothetical protein